MGSRKKNISRVIVISFIVGSFLSTLFNCNITESLSIADTTDGETRLAIGFHGSYEASSARSSQTISGIEALLLTVREIVIIDDNGRHITILKEDRIIDIITASRSDPVLLSSVSVEPGVYKELRLVLKEENTIRIAGETHSIKIPSGEQSGLKLKGPFEIPRGRLFTLNIELDTERSVRWNKGQGYRLHPVLNISNGANVLGIFRGNVTMAKNIGAAETLMQLYDNGRARMRIASFPRYTLWADYNYNSVKREVHFSNISIDAPGLRRRELKQVAKQVPSSISLPVKQWSLNNIIAIDTSGMVGNLYRVDEFNFSSGVSFTEIILNINYPDTSKIGMYVVTEIKFIDTGMPPEIIESVLDGTRIVERIELRNNSIQGSSTRIHISSYLFEKEEDYNIHLGIFANLPTAIMYGSHFLETTFNPWQPADIFTIIRDAEEQEFTVSFPHSMNVRMEHENFTNNEPVISWDPYPKAKGYFVMVVVKEHSINYHKDSFSGSDVWAMAFYGYTNDTNITVYSELITFTETFTGDFDLIEPMIKLGDPIRVEVYALDGSGALDTETKTGALAMNSLNIIRQE